ncbi:MAG: VOC family protein [Sphaerochaetaceae bacterium]
MSVKQHILGLQHIGIPTNDIGKTIDFYESLGFSISYRTVHKGTSVAFMSLGDLVIETYENHQAMMKNGAIDHIALNVDDIEKTYEEIVALGYHSIESMKIDGRPFFSKGVRFFTILGPNGEKVEFNQYL